MKTEKRRDIFIIAGCAALVVLALIVLGITLFSTGGNKYDKYFRQGQSAYESGDYSTAVKVLEKAVSAKGEAEAYSLLAEAYVGGGDTNMAIQALYIGYSKTGSASIASRLEELKALKNGAKSGQSAAAQSIELGGSSVALDSTSLVLNERGLIDRDIAGISALTSLESLSLSDNALTSANALSTLTQLSFLQLGGNSIRDITALRNLSKLKTLYIDGNPISDFTPLYALTSLKTLSMKNIDITESRLAELQDALPNCSIYADEALAEVRDVSIGGVDFKSDVTDLDLGKLNLGDISPLSVCTELTSLNLRINAISDISPLMDLQSLERLELADNRVSDLAPLMTLSRMKYLDVRSNDVSDITVVGYLKGLEQLYLDDNPLSGIGALSSMSSLRILSLKNVGLTDDNLDVLAGLTGLEQLYLDENSSLTANKVDELKEALPRCEISASELCYTIKLGSQEVRSDAVSIYALSVGAADLTGIERFAALRSLILTNNYIMDIQPLAALTELEELDLYSNHISDISPLASLAALRTLDIEHNTVSDISALGACTQLKELQLGFNEICDISPLASCTQLSVLELENNAIDDVSALESLTGLTRLNLDNNSISDLTPLYSLTSLRTLYIRGNPATLYELECLEKALPECVIVCD